MNPDAVREGPEPKIENVRTFGMVASAVGLSRINYSDLAADG